MPHAALWVVQRYIFHADWSLVLVSMPHAALWVVQLPRGTQREMLSSTRFNAARGFVGGAA